MNRMEFLCLFVLYLFYNAVFCGRSALFHETENQAPDFGSANDGSSDFLLDTGKILKRDKRYLLFTNGGISKVI